MVKKILNFILIIFLCETTALAVKLEGLNLEKPKKEKKEKKEKSKNIENKTKSSFIQNKKVVEPENYCTLLFYKKDPIGAYLTKVYLCKYKNKNLEKEFLKIEGIHEDIIRVIYEKKFNSGIR